MNGGRPTQAEPGGAPHEHRRHRCRAGLGGNVHHVLGTPEERDERRESRKPRPEAFPALVINQGLHHDGVELGTGSSPELGEGVFLGVPDPVGAVRKQGVVGVHDRNDAGDGGASRIRLEPGGRSANGFMVTANHRRDLGPDVGGNHLRPRLPVPVDRLGLFRVDGTGSVQDAGGDVEGSDVLQQGRETCDLAVSGREPHLPSQLGRKPGGALGVGPPVHVHPCHVRRKIGDHRDGLGPRGHGAQALQEVAGPPMRPAVARPSQRQKVRGAKPR